MNGVLNKQHHQPRKQGHHEIIVNRQRGCLYRSCAYGPNYYHRHIAAEARKVEYESYGDAAKETRHVSLQCFFEGFDSANGVSDNRPNRIANGEERYREHVNCISKARYARNEDRSIYNAPVALAVSSSRINGPHTSVPLLTASLISVAARLTPQ